MTRKLIKSITIYTVIISAFIIILYNYPEYQKYYPLDYMAFVLLILFLSGFIIRYVGANQSKYDKIQPMLISIGYVFIGFGFYKIVSLLTFPSPLDSYSQHIEIISFVILVAMSTLSITNLFSYGEYIDNFEISRFLTGVLDSQKVIVAIVSLFFLYWIYLRDMIADMVINIDHYDWVIIVIAAVILIYKFYFDVNKRVDYESEYKLGKKHRQYIKRLEDNRLGNLENLQKEFVEDGKKEYLLTYLIEILVSRSDIFTHRRASRVLRPLINYKDRYVPDHSFQWWKDRIRKKNKEKRKKILEQITEEISNKMNVNISNIKEK